MDSQQNLICLFFVCQGAIWKAWWYLDSGCSRDMTGTKSLLTDYEEVSNGPKVVFGDDSTGTTEGYGVV